MEGIENKVIDLIGNFEELTKELAPDVVDAALSAVRVSAIQGIIFAVGGVVASLALIWLVENSMRYCRRKKDEGGYMSDWDIGYVVSFAVGSITSSMFCIIGLRCLLDPWVWVGVFNPKLALAHRILGL